MNTLINKRGNASLFVIIIIALFFPQFIFAQNNMDLYKQALSYKFNDKARYFREMTKLAEKGFRTAQYDLGVDYFNDNELGNLTLAKKWLRTAKDNGDIFAGDRLQKIATIERLLSGGTSFSAYEYKLLGDAYYYNNILIKKTDYNQAVFYYTKATSLGEDCYKQIVESYYWLGDYENVGFWAKKGKGHKDIDDRIYERLYELGKKFKSKANYQKAIICFLSAATYGNYPKAYHELGILYNLGKEGLGNGNVNRDNNYALHCFKKAYSLGCSDSKWWIDQIQEKIYTTSTPQNNSSINYDNLVGAIIGGAIVVGSVTLGAYAISEMAKDLASATRSVLSSNYTYSSNYSTYNSYTSSNRSKESKGSIIDMKKTIMPKERESYITDLNTAYRLKGGSVTLKNGHSYSWYIRISKTGEQYYIFKEASLAWSISYSSFEEMAEAIEDFDYRH